MKYIVDLKKYYETNEKVYNHIDETWSIDLADFSDYKTSNNQGYRFIFVDIDIFSKYTWCISLKNKNVEAISKEFSKFPTSSKRSPLKVKGDRGKELQNSFFQNFSKVKYVHLCSRFRDKGPSVCERVIRTFRKLLEKPILLKSNADWISELPSVFKKYDFTIHSSKK